MGRNKELVSFFLFRVTKTIPFEQLFINRRTQTTLCTVSFTEEDKLALSRNERGMGGTGTPLSMRTNTLECLDQSQC